MAPVINLEYDDAMVQENAVKNLSIVVRDIVSKATEIEDVFVYANTAKIKIKVAPIEIFVKMSAEKIKDQTALMTEIKRQLKEWKSSNDFHLPINITLIPMNWMVEIGI